MKRLMALLAVLTLLLAACGGGGGDAGGDDGGGTSGRAAQGEEIFGQLCAVCHGPDANGVENLGKNLHDNAFVQGKSDQEMVAFLEEGRPVDDPLNTTGVAMPPKGGNAALTEDDLLDVVAFLRTLQ